MSAHNARAHRHTAASKPLRQRAGRVTPSEHRADPQRSPQDSLPLSAAQLLTAEQLATRWQVPKTQVWRLARERAVPVVRIGRYMRFRRDATEQWEEAQADAELHGPRVEPVGDRGEEHGDPVGDHVLILRPAGHSLLRVLTPGAPGAQTGIPRFPLARCHSLSRTRHPGAYYTAGLRLRMGAQ